MKRKKAIYALGILIFFGAAMLLFIIAADEQSTFSSGSPTAQRIRLQDLANQIPTNKHIELTDFYFGKNYVYTSKLLQFTEVYLPVFPRGQSEDASNLRFLIWIRNDRNSNQQLIQTPTELDRFASEYNHHPTSISGTFAKTY